MCLFDCISFALPTLSPTPFPSSTQVHLHTGLRTVKATSMQRQTKGKYINLITSTHFLVHIIWTYTLCGKIIFYCTLFYVTNPQPYPPKSFPTSFALIIIPDNPPKSQTRCYMTTRVSILMAGSTTGCLTGTAFLMSLF